MVFAKRHKNRNAQRPKSPVGELRNLSRRSSPQTPIPAREEQGNASHTPFSLTQEEWDAVVNAVADHRYNLLLGAGASIGALGGDGKALPLAERLRVELCEDFRLPAEELQSLSDAYEEATHTKGPRGETVNAYLKRRFTGCKPSWQDVVLQMPWRRIWNLNIDDVCERAAEVCLSRSQSVLPADWTSAYRDPDDPEEQVQLVYLHGRAEDLGTAKSRLVFSIGEYADATANPHTWHRLFCDLFQQQPFIVVGSKLKDEVDLAAAVRLGNHSFSISKTPSLFISPTISALDANRLRRWGLTPIPTTAEQFFRTLLQAVAPVVHLQKSKTADMHGFRRFVSTFTRLFSERRDSYSRQVDFWSGVEPEWNDVLDKKLVVLRQYNALAKLIEQAVASKDPVRVIWIKGTPAEGKTAAMLWGASELQSHGVATWLFNGRSRLDVSALMSQAESGRATAYLIDHAGDHLFDIEALCSAASLFQLGGPRLILLVAERTRRVDALSALASNPATVSLEIGRIEKEDVRQLVSRLTKEGRLGQLTGSREKEQLRFFLEKNHGSLFDSLMDLELGTGYRARVFAEVAAISRSDERKIVCAISMVHCFGYPLPIAILSRATGIPFAKVLEIVRSARPAGEFLILDKIQDTMSARTLHRRRAEVVVNEIMKSNERYEVGLAIARTCSTYLTMKTIRARDLPYFIVRNLLDRSVAEDWFPSSAHQWYSELEPLYGWNSRYWEQRALLESSLGAHERAISYARTALDRHSDNYTLNTLGTVLMNAAIDPDAQEAILMVDRYREGLAALLQSRELARSRGLVMAHPYVTFFTKTLTFVRTRNPPSDVVKYASIQWIDWLREANCSSLMRLTEFKSMLLSYQEQWKLIELAQAISSSDGSVV